MKIEQKQKFQPITIILETEEEAQVVRDAVLAYKRQQHRHSEQITNDTICAISNFFSNVVWAKDIL